MRWLDMVSSRNVAMCAETEVDCIIRQLVNFVGLEKTVTEMAAGCLRMMKSCHICIK